MTQTRARQILQSLIQGIDPVSGEELPHETVLQRADVLRALLAGLTALEQTAARAQRRAQLPDNVGQSWTTEEESRLVAAFKRGDSPVAIARQHGRTLRAIEARLEKLGLITAEQRTTRGGFTGVSETLPRPRIARGAILGRKRAQRRSRRVPDRGAIRRLTP